MTHAPELAMRKRSHAQAVARTRARSASEWRALTPRPRSRTPVHVGRAVDEADAHLERRPALEDPPVHPQARREQRRHGVELRSDEPDVVRLGGGDQ
jgi:hypothetical protein